MPLLNGMHYFSESCRPAISMGSYSSNASIMVTVVHCTGETSEERRFGMADLNNPKSAMICSLI